MKPILILLLILACNLPAFALEVIRNESPIYTAPPKLIKESPNARLELVGDGEDSIHVLHVWGTPYEMGYAHGEMLRDQIHESMKVVELMTQGMGVPSSHLDQVWESVKPHVSAYFTEEIQGLADGCGVKLEEAIRFNMIGEASEWHCSLFGAWGEATKSTGHLLQLRSLDYAVEASIQNHPVIVVYHPNPGNGHPFANFSWAGFVGTVTGISSERLAISEIGDSYDKKNDDFDGVPFSFMLRDILQFDKSLDEATARICGAKRTTSLMYAVGDGEVGEARSYQTSRTLCNVFDPQNLEPVTDAHKRMEDVVYWGMSWDVPSYDGPLHDMLKKHYGTLTGESVVREVLPTVKTGNLQVAVYDLTDMIVWTANARGDKESGPLNAYERAYVQLSMNPLFGEKRPVIKTKSANSN